MIVQRFLKGITGLTDNEAEEMLKVGGIFSNWWRNAGRISPDEVIDKLTEDNLIRHLNDYYGVDPVTNERVRDVTPFISTTAGAVVRDARGARNLIHGAEYVATRFATDNFRSDGWVFSGYLFTLGRQAVEHSAFSEEVRELHLYTRFLPFQPEGEIVAKVHIPAVQLEEARKFKAHYAPEEPGRTRYPTRVDTVRNRVSYVEPTELVNLRGLL